ncbi:hypothetical protein KIAC18_002610 [Sporomusa sphaeroides]|uniref:hypothetical protein n=1 Tax=Sporomusa sphaeroides TaxID=47679 RepID=UPI003DA13931
MFCQHSFRGFGSGLLLKSRDFAAFFIPWNISFVRQRKARRRQSSYNAAPLALNLRFSEAKGSM